MKHFVVLTGAGMSAESGLKTFREAGGLWEGHDVNKVATPEAFNTNPALVLDFYNQRRRQLLEAKPNPGHFDLVKFEKDFKVTIITQNIDDLHERSGSTNVMHLHGELFKVRSTFNETDIIPWRTDLLIGNTCKMGYQLRPHIVWFGEPVPMMEKAIEVCMLADYLIIIGTSMQVYPAASLIHYVPLGIPIYFIDPNPSLNSKDNITVIAEPATIGVKILLDSFKK